MTNTPSSDNEKFVFPKRYEDVEPLAVGGMGAVFKAKDPILDKTVALKFLSNDNWDDDKFVRFQREARALARLKHPGIGSILDFGVNQRGQPFMVLDMIEGSDLASFKSQNHLSIKDSIDIMVQICESLNHAHSKGIVHRDIKPNNIIVRRDENGQLHATLIDFGIAKFDDSEGHFSTVSRPDTIIGSPLYMSPEQIRNESITAQSDIYSLGCVLYFLITSSPPFEGESALETAAMHLNNTPPDLPPIGNATVTTSIQAIVSKCLEKKPGLRFVSVNGLREELIGVPLNSVHVENQETGPSVQPAPRKGRLLPLLIVSTFAILVSTGILITPRILTALHSWEEDQALSPVPPDMEIFTKRELRVVPLEAPDSMTKTSYDLPEKGMFTWNKTERRLSILGSNPDKVKEDIATMKTLLKNEKIRTLHLSHANLHRLPKSFMQELQKQTDLVDLELMQITDNDLPLVAPIPSVIVFRITSTEFNGTTLKTLTRFEKIKRVCLNGCNRIKDIYLRDLAAIKDLDAVELTKAPSIEKSDFIELARLPIEFLVVKHSRFDAINLPQLLKTRTIKSLVLEETSVTDMDVRLLQNIRTLKILDLTNCQNVHQDTIDKIPKRIKVVYDP